MQLLAIGPHYPDRSEELQAVKIVREYASRHLDDLEVQIAAADSMDDLRVLAPHSPHSPALNAAILRTYLTLSFSLQRGQEYWLDGTPKGK